eukprot:scaffold42938_cov256-Skeletonema_marinoi.AAC.1
MMGRQSLLASIASTVVLIGWAVDAFSHHATVHHHRWSIVQQSSCRVNHNNNYRWSCRMQKSTSSSLLHAETTNNNAASSPSLSSSSIIPSGENYSTLTLLEHMHLLHPNVHKPQQSTTTNNNKSDNIMIDFFTNTLGFGMDPKSVNSLQSNKGVVFVNAGSTQLHLNDDEEYCQKLDELLLRRQKEDLATSSSSSSSTKSSSGGHKHLFEIGLRYNSLKDLKNKLANYSGDACSYDMTTL